MSQNNNELEQIRVNQPEFKMLATGTSTVYEKIIRTYHPTGQLVSEVLQNFYLAYKVYYCDLTKSALVAFWLCQSDKQSARGYIAIKNQVRTLKAEPESLHEALDKLLDHQCVVAANEVRDLLAIDSDEVPF